MIPPSWIAAFGKTGAKIIWWGVILGLLTLLLLLMYCSGRKDGKTGEVVKQQAREIEVVKQVGNASETAAETRVTDAVRTEQQSKELSDAIKVTGDPDKQRALRGCIILRQQHADLSGIPACRGLAD